MLLEIFATVVNFITIPNHSIISAIQLIICFPIVYYALVGYKKPHGNILKYTMIFFGFSLLLNIHNGLILGVKSIVWICAISMLLIGYISGRLHKFNQNRLIALQLFHV